MKAQFLTADVISKLSPLESEIIKTINPKQTYTTSEVYSLIKKRKKVAESSIPVLLDRLHQKGLLKRNTENAKGGIRFIYSINESKEEFERSVVENVVNKLVDKFGSKAIAYFNESFKRKK